MRHALLAACAAAAVAASSGPARVCPPPGHAAADLLIVVAGGRPDGGLWRSVRAEAAAWLAPAADGGPHAAPAPSVRVAVVQHSAVGGLELLSAPAAGGFVSSAAELELVEPEHFRRCASAATAPGPWRRPNPKRAAEVDAVAGLRAAAAALQALALPRLADSGGSSPALLLRQGHAGSTAALRVLLVTTSTVMDINATAPPTRATARLARQVAAIQAGMQLEFGAANDAVAAVRSAAAKLRRRLVSELNLSAGSAAAGNAEIDTLRLGLLIDSTQPPALRRTLYGEKSVEDAYRDGRECGGGVTYHRARDACRNDWHPLCGKGGALQGRLLHDGIGVRITEQGAGRLPLRWLVPLPRQLLPPCEPTHPWALPKQPPVDAPEQGDEDEGGHDEGNESETGSCQLHSGGGGAAGTVAAAASREASSRVAERLSAVSGAEEIQTMLSATDVVDGPENRAEEEAWRKELEGMACGSPHAGEPLIEQPAEGLPSAESQAGGEQRGVKVVDWGSHPESGHRTFTEWAVEGEVPVLLTGTDLSPWVEDQTSDFEANEEGRGWGWAAFRKRLADQPMLETKRSKLSAAPGSDGSIGATGSSGGDGSALFFDPDATRAPLGWAGLVGGAGAGKK